MYLQLLTGRFRFGHLDFSEELASRAQPATPINDHAYGCEAGTFENLVGNVADYIATLYADGCMAQADKSIEDFCADFLSWSTSGSAPSKGLYVADQDGNSYSTSGGSKVAQLNTMGVQGILDCFGDRPQCVGQPTHKYEAGKLRMLLPGPLKHWIMESIALWGGEGHVLRSIDNITMEQNSFVEFSQMTMRMTSSMCGLVRACSDYADYNILHTFKRMQMLWYKQARAIAGKLSLPACTEITSARTMTDFMQIACRWCASALNRVSAKLPDGQLVELVRGLWSGWRSTMYINVTYNFAYTTAQRLMFIRRYGIDPLSRYNVLGDDMEGDSPSLWTALKFVSLVDELGLDAQADKQMVSLRRAEYLRLMYREGPTVCGSYCRAIAGQTSGDTQTSPRYAGIRSVQNVNEGINRCIRRGGNLERLERMRNIAVKFWSVVEMNGQKYRPKASVLRSPAWLGGMGVCRCDGKDAIFAANETPGAISQKVTQQHAHLSKLMCSAGYSMISSWYDGRPPASGDVDSAILVGILPPALKSKLIALERLKTVEYYRQKSRTIKPCIVLELQEEFFAIMDKGIRLDANSLSVDAKPDKWWSGMVRDVLGPLASHPKADRFLGRTTEQKMLNVITHSTNRVHDARAKFLNLDPLTRKNTVTGELKMPSPLAGLVSPLLRHVVACCHSAYILWLKRQSLSCNTEWYTSMVNALYTFEMCFLARQTAFLSKWRV
jgi:septum formation topological specificity factor MinE